MRDALDLAGADAQSGIKFELFEAINDAHWRDALDKCRASHEISSRITQARVTEHTTDEGWLTFIRRIDDVANDGIKDSECTDAQAGRPCHARGKCIACRVAERE